MLQILQIETYSLCDNSLFKLIENKMSILVHEYCFLKVPDLFMAEWVGINYIISLEEASFSFLRLTV